MVSDMSFIFYTLSLSLSPLVYGPALLTHCLLGTGLPENSKIGTDINAEIGQYKYFTWHYIST